MANVTLDVALKAFEEFVASPGTFKIETNGDASIEFCASFGSVNISLDLWGFEGSGLDTVGLSIPAARDLIKLVFSEQDDMSIGSWIIENAA